jgi:hypothetical protein
MYPLRDGFAHLLRVAETQPCRLILPAVHDALTPTSDYGVHRLALAPFMFREVNLKTQDSALL